MTAGDTILLHVERCPKRDGQPHCRHRVSETRTFGVLTESLERCCFCSEEARVKHDSPPTGGISYSKADHGPYEPQSVLVFSRD